MLGDDPRELHNLPSVIRQVSLLHFLFLELELASTMLVVEPALV